MEVPDVYRSLAQHIEEGEVDAATAEAKRLVESGHTITDLFQQGIVPCMTEIGERFSNFELFLPDMMRAAEVVKAIHKELAEKLRAETGSAESTGKIVLGTVTGDVHDIGKNIVRTMLEVNGFEVLDLGVDVPAQEFIKRAREAGADIIALSSLMTTSIPYMEDVINLVRESEQDRDRFKLMIGGGPVTPEYAREIGADAYGRDAAEAVKQARLLMEQIRVVR